MIDLAFKGGWINGGIVTALSDGYLYFCSTSDHHSPCRKEDETFMNRIKDYIHEGKSGLALNLCRSTAYTPSARMIEKGITRWAVR